MVQTAVTSPPPSPLRENAGWVALLVVAGVATLLCFRMWLLTYLRPSVPIVTLPEPGPENGARASGAAPAPTVPGVSASARATRLPAAEEEFSLGRKPDQ